MEKIVYTTSWFVTGSVLSGGIFTLWRSYDVQEIPF